MLTFDHYNHNIEEIKQQAGAITDQKLSATERKEALKTILSCIDLTTLEGSDTNEKIITMCKTARSFSLQGAGVPNVAAVCFYPPFVKLAKEELAGTGIQVASVAAGFPSGQLSINLKVAEVEFAVAEGADEIDIVISRGKLIANKCNDVYEEIVALKKACGPAELKVILETGELETVYRIRKACEISLKAGADFLKTSTGKMQPAATPEAFLIMLHSIDEFHKKTGKMVGIKAAGGIADPDEAIKYYQLVKYMLGAEWLNNKLFRIGASRLAQKVADEIMKG
jgi:deoxyribose-phosphate aldolase